MERRRGWRNRHLLPGRSFRSGRRNPWRGRGRILSWTRGPQRAGFQDTHEKVRDKRWSSFPVLCSTVTTAFYTTYYNTSISLCWTRELGHELLIYFSRINLVSPQKVASSLMNWSREDNKSTKKQEILFTFFLLPSYSFCFFIRVLIPIFWTITIFPRLWEDWCSRESFEFLSKLSSSLLTFYGDYQMCCFKCY